MHTHCWVLGPLSLWDLDIPSSKPPSRALKCVFGVVELTGVAFPGAQLTGEGREGGRGEEQEERVQETRRSRGTEAESPEMGKSNSEPFCTWKRTEIEDICCVGVTSGIDHCLLLHGSWGLGCQISVQTADVGLGHKGEMLQLLKPYRVVFLFLQEENEQQEPLQKREDEGKERGKTVLELKNLLEQQQLGQAKERCELVPVLEPGIGHGHGEAVDVNVMLHLGSGTAWRLREQEQEAVRG